jgi:hypothetical protein
VKWQIQQRSAQETNIIGLSIFFTVNDKIEINTEFKQKDQYTTKLWHPYPGIHDM